MSREILLLVDALSREKNVDKETVFGALELALASATKKKFQEDVDIRAHVDRATGEFSFFRRWQVVPDEEFEVPSRQYMLHEARVFHRKRCCTQPKCCVKRRKKTRTCS